MSIAAPSWCAPLGISRQRPEGTCLRAKPPLVVLAVMSKSWSGVPSQGTTDICVPLIVARPFGIAHLLWSLALTTFQCVVLLRRIWNFWSGPGPACGMLSCTKLPLLSVSIDEVVVACGTMV